MKFLPQVICLIAVGILLAGCATSLAEKGPVRLRVMSYNIHHGEGVDGKLDLERIAKLISESRADLVALQEVDKGAHRTKGMDIAAELGRLTGMTPVFRKNHDLNPGEYGNAILSRLPVEAVTNVWLPRLTANEQRGFLQTTIRVGKRKLLFASTHLDHRGQVEEDRLASVAKIREMMSSRGNAGADWQMIVGDFNARPTSNTYRQMAAQFRDAWAIAGQGDGFTIPVGRPSARIDYVWFAGAPTLAPVSAEILSSDASDHLPLLVEFQISE